MSRFTSVLTSPEFAYALGGLVLLYTLTIFAVYIYMAARAWRRFKPAPVINAERPSVSILVPAYNEEVTIIDSIESMLGQDYGNFEIVVINDGSSDSTSATLLGAYDFLAMPVPTIESQQYMKPVTAMYQTRDGRITLVVTENGGKSSALNVGAAVAQGEWVLCVDADTLLVPNAISNTMSKLRPDIDAISAMVGVANGQDINNPEVPKAILPRIQWLEYLRSFILWRTANDDKNCTLVISGAFGIFKRDIVLQAGYKHGYLGEDMEITMNIHALGGKVQFLSEIMAWTEVPENLKALGKQRRRWYRGGLQCLLKYRGMAFKKKDNKFLGYFMIPFLWFADIAGPWVELFGYLLTAWYIHIGAPIDWEIYLALFAIITLSHYLSMGLVVGFAYKRLDSNVAPRKWYRVIPIILTETFTYHFIHYWWMLRSHTEQYIGAKKKWNKFERKGFARP